MNWKTLAASLLLVAAVGCGGGDTVADGDIPHVDPESVRLETDLADPATASGGVQESMKKAARNSGP